MNIFPPVCLPSARLDQADIPVWITGDQTERENVGKLGRLTAGWGLLGENSFGTPDKLHHLELR